MNILIDSTFVRYEDLSGEGNVAAVLWVNVFSPTTFLRRKNELLFQQLLYSFEAMTGRSLTTVGSPEIMGS